MHKQIWFLFIVTLLIRIYIAFSRSDFIWPDEHFQSIEPASKIVYGFGTLTWEWVQGYRPWTVPALYMPLLYLLKLIGIYGGPLSISLCRAFTAVFSTSVFFSIHRVLERLGAANKARLIALAASSLSASNAIWSCAPFSDNWAMIVLWAILPEILDRFKSQKNLDWFWIGILAGLPVLIKLQMAIWTIGLCLTLAILGASLNLILWMTLGGLVDLISLGALDAFSFGRPFNSLIAQITRGREIGITNGVSPWWSYFAMIGEKPVPPIFILIAALTSLVALWPRSRNYLAQRFRESRLSIAIVMGPILVFLVTMMTIEHKELRFLLPIFPVTYVYLGFLSDVIIRVPFLKISKPFHSIRARFANIRTSLRIRTSLLIQNKLLSQIGVIVIILSAAVWTAKRAISATLPFTETDLTSLEKAIYNDHGLNLKGENCILLVDHHFIWTHGQLILGAPTEVIDMPLDQMTKENFSDCRYAILPTTQEATLKSKGGIRWSSMNVLSHGYGLYKNGESSN